MENPSPNPERPSDRLLGADQSAGFEIRRNNVQSPDGAAGNRPPEQTIENKNSDLTFGQKPGTRGMTSVLGADVLLGVHRTSHAGALPMPGKTELPESGGASGDLLVYLAGTQNQCILTGHQKQDLQQFFGCLFCQLSLRSVVSGVRLDRKVSLCRWKRD